MSEPPQIILASASPRRRELLGSLGVDFVVQPSHVNEDPRLGESPLETQHRITREKARSVAASGNTTSEFGSATIIACDTTVILDGEMLNKPANAGEARSMLRSLRNRAHDVQSAIVIRRGEDEQIEIVTSRVLMRDYSDAEIEAYISTGDPFDKAGGYAVQHRVFQPVSEIRGCPLNVIGLSLCHLCARMPELPECTHVCLSYFEKPCPQRLDDPTHVVSGQIR